MKSTVSALDFGTSKIVALAAETGGKQRCDIIGAGTVAYDGYMDGQWNGPELLNEAIAAALREAEEQAHVRIRDVNVGVPGAFSTIKTVEVKVDLQGADPKVTEKDVVTLFQLADQALGEIRGSVIHRSPAWFVVDDGKKVIEPVGMHGYELRAMVGYVIADPFFMEDVAARLRDLGRTVNGWFSSMIGQMMLFLPSEERDRATILVDMGYLNTEVMAVEGDAITWHQTIPLGGGHISADLAYGLEITLQTAEQIKRSYIYGLSAGQTTFEGMDAAGTSKTFTREDVERVLEPRAEEICEAVGKAIEQSGVKTGKWSTIFLTGGGLAINRGGRDFLSAKLDKPVRELPHKTSKLSSPAYSSALGLLDLVIDTSEKVHGSSGVSGFFRSLFGS